MEQKENIQQKRVMLTIKLLKFKKSLPLLLYLPQATQCLERIHYEKNVNHSFKTWLWKKLMRKQLEGEASSSFSNKWS